MTYKQIEASREARLWIKDVIVPVAATAVLVLSYPPARDYVNEKVAYIKNKIKTKCKRGS